MSFITDAELAVKQHLAKFAQCHQDEQQLLLVLAVIHKPVFENPLNLILAGLSENGVLVSPAPQMNQAMCDKLAHLDLINDTSDGLTVNSLLSHVLTSQSVKNGSLAGIIEQSNEIIPVKVQHAWHDQSELDRQTEFRQYLYLQDFDACLNLVKPVANPQVIDLEQSQWLIDLCFYPFDSSLFSLTPAAIQYQAFAALLTRLRESMRDNTQIVALLQKLYSENLLGVDLQLLLAEQYLLRNETIQAELLLTGLPASAYRLSLSGWLSFLQGNAAGAVKTFDHCIQAKYQGGRRVRQHVGGLPGIFYLLALLKSAYLDDITLFSQLFAEISHYKWEKYAHKQFVKSYQVIEQMANVLSSKSETIHELVFEPDEVTDDYYSSFCLLISALCFIWSGKPVPLSYRERLKQNAQQAQQSGSLWYSDIAQAILANGDRAEQPEPEPEPALEQNPEQQAGNNNTLELLRLLIKKEPWLQALDQLIALKNRPIVGINLGTGAKQSRMAWILTPHFPYNIEAKEQTISTKGWSKGRLVPLKRLVQTPEQFDFLTPSDLKLCQAIKTIELVGRFKTKADHVLAGYGALEAIVGHARVFLSHNMELPLKITEAPPELMITETSAGYRIFLTEIPQDIDDWQFDNIINGSAKREQQVASFCFTNHGQSHFVLTSFSAEHMKIAEIVGGAGLQIPWDAKDKVLESIAAVAPLLNIQSNIAGIADLATDIEQVAPQQTLFINIQPLGQGLQMECHVQPLGEQGPNLMPGLGNSTVVAQIDNHRLMTHRDLDLEEQYLDALIVACPMFSYMSEHQLLLNNIEDALTTLEQLEVLQQCEAAPDVVLQWPHGQKITLTTPLGQQKMNVSVAQQQDWFSIQGQLSIGEGQVLELKDLLNLMDRSPGRFVRLEDNSFITLTEELKQQLNNISASTYDGQFHPLAAPLIEQSITGMQVNFDQQWQQQLDRLKESFSLTPELPSSLQADLRDYQKQGFDWGYRLAHWGAGACLADDMGLGKTLQALALILSRGVKGPTLVLAPTSVCFNWQEEANRFAPSLNVKMFGMAPKNERLAMLDNLQPLDLVICSYGLLSNEAEPLTKVNWHTLVADEAQAIKNPQAKRTQVAMALKGDFKMITTGTPIENNLIELWSLFRFINPGLLGSQKQFQQRFINPMENAEKDQRSRNQASRALRHALSPFILRRLKSEVLTELPSRTEINLHVELSPEELVFYEALRQQSVEKLQKTDDKPGQKRIKILAEIMRLRRACCHPSLVMPDSTISGAKLKVFDALIDELKQGNHRALVFSQFVGHLAILKNHLNEKGVKYQYLDGSTSAAKRKSAVDDFQGGSGDLFLISLKAGGAGLNLTAADYVIHMDPWWNPAVEDQASDRAHRMGQSRPVTIYRLITQNTIEDKIVALHQRKRDLANSLLEGTDSAASISLDDMMNLLQHSVH